MQDQLSQKTTDFVIFQNGAKVHSGLHRFASGSGKDADEVASAVAVEIIENYLEAIDQSDFDGVATTEGEYFAIDDSFQFVVRATYFGNEPLLFTVNLS